MGLQTSFNPVVPRGRPKTGSTYSYVIPGVEATGVATVALTANQARYEQWIVDTPITIDQLLCETTGAGAGGTTIRMGIYNADVDWQPLGLVVDAGTVTADTLAVKTLSIAQTLAAGRYLCEINSDGTPTMRCLRAGAMLAGYAVAFGAAPFVASLTVGQTYGALPGTGLAWTALNAGGGSPAQHCVICRVITP